ncbi:uncharacterized protein LOC144710152 [Wolffia australiana]
MLLRSSSTPIFGSLLAGSSCSESPGHGGSGSSLERAHSDLHSKLSFSHGGAGHHHQHHHHHHLQASSFHGVSLHLSHSPSADPQSGAPVGFRRVRSEGNLQDLQEEHRRPGNLPPPARPPRRAPVLESIPSFSLRSSPLEEDDVEEEFDDVASFGREKGELAVGSPLFLAKGLGLEEFGGAASELILGIGGGTGGIGSGGGGFGGRSVVVDGNGSQADMEAYYKKMVEEDPGNALLLTNFAQFLHQSKRDLKRAEEFYSRAVLAEPGDGEVLCQYAKVIWELHHDRSRATGYYEQAVQAAPQNSHVLASYASFLWEAEDDEEEEEEEEEEEVAEEAELFAETHIHLMASPPTLSC